MRIWDRDLRQHMQRKARWTFTEEVCVSLSTKILLFSYPLRYISVCVFLARNGTSFRSDKGAFIVQLRKKSSPRPCRQEISFLIQRLYYRHRVELPSHRQRSKRRVLPLGKDAVLPHRGRKDARVEGGRQRGGTMRVKIWITLRVIQTFPTMMSCK